MHIAEKEILYVIWFSAGYMGIYYQTYEYITRADRRGWYSNKLVIDPHIPQRKPNNNYITMIFSIFRLKTTSLAYQNTGIGMYARNSPYGTPLTTWSSDASTRMKKWKQQFSQVLCQKWRHSIGNSLTKRLNTDNNIFTSIIKMLQHFFD